MNTPVTIYLDQNKWIDLSRAYYGRQGGEEFVETLRLVQKVVDQGIARFPISAEHILETIERGNADSRARLAHFMAEISQGLTLAPKESIMPFELEIALAKIFNKTVLSPSPVILGLGMGFIWGVKGLGLLENGLPLMMQTVEKEVADELDMEANLVKGARMSLTHIFEQTEESLRKEMTQRYNRDIKLMAQNTEKIRQIHKKYSKDQRYLLYAASQIGNLQDNFLAALARLGLTLEDFLAIGTSNIKLFYEAIPTLNVIIELATGRDVFYNKAISENDATDISFLSVAIPYCDAVVTEKFWVDVIEKRELNAKYGITVFKNLHDLGSYLTNLSA